MQVAGPASHGLHFARAHCSSVYLLSAAPEMGSTQQSTGHASPRQSALLAAYDRGILLPWLFATMVFCPPGCASLWHSTLLAVRHWYSALLGVCH